jgi:hypothetical protein
MEMLAGWWKAFLEHVAGRLIHGVSKLVNSTVRRVEWTGAATICVLLRTNAASMGSHASLRPRVTPTSPRTQQTHLRGNPNSHCTVNDLEPPTDAPPQTSLRRQQEFLPGKNAPAVRHTKEELEAIHEADLTNRAVTYPARFVKERRKVPHKLYTGKGKRKRGGRAVTVMVVKEVTPEYTRSAFDLAARGYRRVYNAAVALVK